MAQHSMNWLNFTSTAFDNLSSNPLTDYTHIFQYFSDWIDMISASAGITEQQAREIALNVVGSNRDCYITEETPSSSSTADVIQDGSIIYAAAGSSKAEYYRKGVNNTFTQLFLETLDSQVLLEAPLTIGGTTYPAGTPVSTILPLIIANSNEYRIVQGTTANIVKLQVKVWADGVSSWQDVTSVTINNVAHATSADNATNVNLTATGSGSASISVQAGSGSAASFTVNNVAHATSADNATNAVNATNATNATNVDLVGSVTNQFQIPQVTIDGVIRVNPNASTPVTSLYDIFTTKAGDGEDASIQIESVNKAYRDLSGNIIEETYATKAELAGQTNAYVTDSPALTGSKFYPLLVTKTEEQEQVAISVTNADNLPLINSGTVSVQNLKVGDTIYITTNSYYDWFIASRTETQNDITLLFSSIEADSPVLDGYVTGSNLTARHVIWGNDGSTIQASPYTIGTSATSTSTTELLTASAISTKLTNAIAKMVETAASTTTLTNDKLVLGNGSRVVKTSGIGIVKSGETIALGDEDEYVPTLARVQGLIPTAIVSTPSATTQLQTNHIILGNNNDRTIKSSNYTISNATLGTSSTVIPTSNAVSNALDTKVSITAPWLIGYTEIN